MNTRGYVGASLWSLGFYVSVALAALYLGLGVALALFSLRHILMGIPRVFAMWRVLVFGREQSARFPPVPERKWPNSSWAIDSLIYIGATVFVLLRFNIRLIDVLIR